MRTENALFASIMVGAMALLPLAAHAGTTAELPAQDLPAAAPKEPAGPQIHPQPGPAKIPLGHRLTLELPEEHVFIKGSEAKPLLERSGNYFGDGFLGIVVPADATNAKWWVAIEYADEGYIKDDDKLDADEILKSIKEGNDEANELRKQKGQPELIVDGWGEIPHYDRNEHHLIWAILGHDAEGKTVNYNTRILGRHGLVSLNLITDPATLDKDKPEVKKLLTRTTFETGARYADFDSKTDKVATYGLAALVAGGAGAAALKIAKIGILAKFGKVLLGILVAGKKLVVFVFLAIGAFFKKLFGGKTDDRPPPPSMMSQSPPPAATTKHEAGGDEDDASDDPHRSGPQS